MAKKDLRAQMDAARAAAAFIDAAHDEREASSEREGEKAGEVAETPMERAEAEVLVPMTAEQREHADLLASVMKVTRAEVMRQALDEYWESHKAELQAAVAAYEELIKKLMK